MSISKSESGTLIRPFLRLYLAIAFMFLFLPIAVVILYSINEGRYPTFPLRGFTLDWYVELVNDSRLLGSLKNSIIVASSVGLLSIIFGFMGAYALRSYKFRGESILLGFMVAPLTVPPLILAVALLFFLSNILSIGNSLFSVIISHLVFCAPFAMFIIRARLSSIGPSLEEAAMDLGARKRRFDDMDEEATNEH